MGKRKIVFETPEETAPKWEQNVPDEVFNAWKALKRHGDGREICQIYGWSQPTVTKALRHGYATAANLVANINEFFLERLKREEGLKEEILKRTLKAFGYDENN